MNFYNNLEKACTNSGIALTKAVLDAGGKLGSINGWKNGSAPNSKIVYALALRLNVTSDYLLGLPEKQVLTPELSETETELLSLFRACPDADKENIILLARSFAEREASARKKGKKSV